MTIKDEKVAYKPIATCHEDHDPIQVTEAYLVQQDENQPRMIQTATAVPEQFNTTAAITTYNCLQEEGYDDYRPNYVTVNTNSHLTVLEAPVAQETPIPAFYKVQGTVKMPSNIFIEKDELNPSTKIIRRKWVVDCGLLFFTIVWNAFMSFWNIASITNGAWDGLLMGSLHNAIGIALILKVVHQMKNSTYITLDGMYIHVDHRPIRICSKTIMFPVNQIGEICCKKCVEYNKKREPSIYFEVHVIGNDGTRTILLSRLNTLEEALFIAQEIENFHPLKTNKQKLPQSSAAAHANFV